MVFASTGGAVRRNGPWVKRYLTRWRTLHRQKIPGAQALYNLRLMLNPTVRVRIPSLIRWVYSVGS